MHAIPAQAIKQRGISAVDKLLERGPVHVIARNRPKFVVMDEASYEELVDAHRRAFIAEVREAIAEVEAGHLQSFETTAELMAAIDQAGDDE
jgi:PHD/YefM family antitoxin component YafN of YafNO toxin-antitoxin module